MRAFRSVAAQYEAHKKVIQTSIGGGAVLFCLSLGTSHANADDSSLTSSTTADSNSQVLQVAQTSSSQGSSSDANPVDSQTQSSLDSQSLSSSSNNATSLNSISTQIDGSTVTLANAITSSENTLSVIADPQALLTNVPEAQSVVDGVTAVIAVANTSIQDANTALTVAQSSADLVTVAQAGLDSANAAVDSTQQDLATATTDASTAQAAADASTVTVTVNGVTATVYRATNGSSPVIANQTPVETLTLPYMSNNWGSGQILNSGLSDHVIVKYEGTITVPNDAVAVKYAVYSDDGAKLYLDGNLAISNWRDQGPTWSSYSPTYNTTTDKSQDFVLWYYENGGGAACTLGWGLTFANGTGYFTTPLASLGGTTGAAGGAGIVSTNYGSGGGGAGGSLGAAGSSGGAALLAAGSGGSGGGLAATSPVFLAGGSGSYSSISTNGVAPARPAGGLTAGASGTNAAVSNGLFYYPGQGAAGGASNTSGTAGAGGAGAFGGGGAGGGSNLNTFTAGIGGKGGDGFVFIVEYF